METKQLKLLTSLANKIKTEKKDRSKVVTTLKSARILTKNENFTSYYSNLGKVVEIVK